MDTAALRAWLEDLPAGTLLPAGELVAHLDTAGSPGINPAERTPEPTAAERLWSCPDHTRYTVKDLAACLGRPTSYIYALTSAKAIPFTKLDGQITFIASEIRRWLVEREERVSL